MEPFPPNFPSSNSSSATTLFEWPPEAPEYGHHHPQWSFEENKRFENALAEFDVDVGAEVDLIEKIHTRVPEKTLWEIKKHLDDLCDDIDKIETGLIPIPDYDDDDTTTIGPTNHDQVNSSSNNPSSCSSRRKKKGVLWTDEEHELFLAGLKKYGKGDWKSISRFCVVTRNPTQVASHAQKWFLRHHNPNSNSQSQSHHNTVNGDGPSDQSTGLQNHTEVRKKRKYTRRKKAQAQ